MPNIKVEINKHNKNTLEKAQQKYPDTQLCNYSNKKRFLLNGNDIPRVLSTKLIPKQTLLVIKKKFTLVYPKQHLKFAMVTTKNCLQNNVIKLYGIIEGVLKGKTTERNNHNKVESIKEMSRLQSKEKTVYLMPK